MLAKTKASIILESIILRFIFEELIVVAGQCHLAYDRFALTTVQSDGMNYDCIVLDH